MKYKITEVDTDAINNVAVKVTYTDGANVTTRVFNFAPDTAKADLLQTIVDSVPTEDAEAKTADDAKATLATALVTDVAKEKDKEVTL